jgi:hypothetical protein
MNILGWGSRKIKVESMSAGCKIGDGYIQCTVSEVSDKGLTCIFPTSRFKESMTDVLHGIVSISIDNTLMEGTLSWYTLEESTYQIGIAIARKDLSAWRKVLSCRNRGVMHTSTRPASV